MPSEYWIKLHHSLLNNFTVMQLSDRHFVRLIQLFLIFGRYGIEQPNERVMAELLGIPIDEFRKDLVALQSSGLIERDRDYWISDLYESMQGRRPSWLSLVWMSLRKKVLARDNSTCGYCGEEATHVDHVMPRCRGGEDELDNLVAACAKCNMTKSARTPQEAGMELI
jgi:hypothetical protein